MGHFIFKSEAATAWHFSSALPEAPIISFLEKFGSHNFSRLLFLLLLYLLVRCATYKTVVKESRELEKEKEPRSERKMVDGREKSRHTKILRSGVLPSTLIACKMSPFLSVCLLHIFIPLQR